jgi:hypothetical protein
MKPRNADRSFVIRNKEGHMALVEKSGDYWTREEAEVTHPKRP